MANTEDWWSSAPVAPQAPAEQWWANAPLAAPEDPIKAQVRKEIADLRAKGVPVDDGYARQFLQGRSFGAADEILAGLTTPLEMLKRGTLNPVEAYNYAKAREDVLMEDARKRGGTLGTVAEAVGGLTSGGELAKAGYTLAKPGAGIVSNALRTGGEGLIYGGVTGFNEGEGADRLTNATKGAAAGGIAGGVVGAAAPLVSTAARNATGWLSASINPDKFAAGQIARIAAESGKTPAQIAQEMADAAAAGQPYTLADALGNSGQRALSTVVRNPGAGRTDVVNFLDARQGGQGRRIANVLAEGLDAPQTAAQATEAMKAARTADAAANYGAARSAAGAVDVSPAIKAADDILQPGVNPILSPRSGMAENSIEGAVRRARAFLTDGRSQVSDFNQAFRAKQEIDALIDSAGPTIQRQLIPIRNALDDALAASSQPYAQARNAFRAQSKAIDAVQTGNAAARAGRTEDTVRRFGAMTPEEQAGFRVGYGDRLIEGVQGQAFGANKARPFTSDAYQTELQAFAAPGRADPLMGALQRENTMFETRATAMGGSKTADNLADSAAMGVSPEIIGNIASGNWLGAARNIVSRSSDTLSGNTAKVREKLAKALLQVDSGASRQTIERSLETLIKSKEAREKLVKALLSGAFGGSASGAQNIRQRTN